VVEVVAEAALEAVVEAVVASKVVVEVVVEAALAEAVEAFLPVRILRFFLIIFTIEKMKKLLQKNYSFYYEFYC